MFDEPEYVGPGALPGEPTDALPGSERKIQIMTERATRHEQLFHPKDGLRQLAKMPRVPEFSIAAWASELRAATRGPAGQADLVATG